MDDSAHAQLYIQACAVLPESYKSTSTFGSKPVMSVQATVDFVLSTSKHYDLLLNRC